MKSRLICHGRLRDHALVRHVMHAYGVELLFTTAPRHARELAMNIDTEIDVLMVAGGDGTLHEVVDGLMQLPQGARPSILLLPLGSGNDTARMIGARATIADVSRRLSDLQPVEWDVLQCAVGNDGDVRYCTNVLDVGFGGDVARRFNTTFRKLPARLAYIAATLQSFASSRAHEISVYTDDADISAPMLMAVVANSKWFGSGIGIAPHAIPHDGIIDLTLITNVGVLAYLRFLPQLIKGSAISDSRMQYLRSTRVRITSNRPLPIEIDGEFAGYTPLHVHVHRGAVRLLV